MAVKKYDIKYGLRERHPALLWYILSFLLLLIIVLLGFIAVFVPWAEVDIAVGVRASAHPFETCLIQTFSKAHLQTCLDNDFIIGPEGAPVTGMDPTCQAFVLTTIANVFMSVIGGVFILIALGFFIYQIWSRPLCFALALEACFFYILATCISAWVLWIFYAERTCVPNSIFPIHGYSFGFFLYVANTGFAICLMITGLIGFFKLKNYTPLTEDDLNAMYGYPEYPAYPAYPMLAVTEAGTPVPEV